MRNIVFIDVQVFLLHGDSYSMLWLFLSCKNDVQRQNSIHTNLSMSTLDKRVEEIRVFAGKNFNPMLTLSKYNLMETSMTEYFYGQCADLYIIKFSKAVNEW